MFKTLRMTAGLFGRENIILKFSKQNYLKIILQESKCRTDSWSHDLPSRRLHSVVTRPNWYQSLSPSAMNGITKIIHIRIFTVVNMRLFKDHQKKAIKLILVQ
jgi:hypothetical protein